MSRVDLAGIDYLGADVVPELVEENRRRHGAAGKRFELLDATRDPLPQVDLVFCRDLLIHLSNADAAKLLANVARSGSRWLLTTHFTGHRANLDILSGDFRPLNLCRPPFLLPPPVEVIAEESRLSGGIFPDRAMGLWEVASLP